MPVVRMLATHACADYCLQAGKMYSLPQKEYDKLAPYNTAETPIFDSTPIKAEGERVFNCPTAADPGDEAGSKGAVVVKQPTFTAVSPEPAKAATKK